MKYNKKDLILENSYNALVDNIILASATKYHLNTYEKPSNDNFKAFVKHLLADNKINNLISESIVIALRHKIEGINNTEFKLIQEKALHYVKNFNESLNNFSECIVTENQVKEKGIILTPYWLAKSVLEKISFYWNKQNYHSPKLVGDLSCGMGVFIPLFGKFFNNTSIIALDLFESFCILLNILFYNQPNIHIACLDSLFDVPNDKIRENSFDIIVGNPPYVRYQSLSQPYISLLKDDNFYGKYLHGNFDLTIPFIAQTLRMLKPGGLAGLILSSKFMTSSYGKTICNKLSKEACLLEIIDFGDYQVFKGRTTYTCVLLFSKSEPKKTVNIIKFPSGNSNKVIENFPCNEIYESVPICNFLTHPWTINTSQNNNIIDLLVNKRNQRISDVFDIVQGVRTGANDVFIVEDNKYNSNDKLLSPFVNGNSIKKGYITNVKQIIWPYQIIENKIKLLQENEVEEFSPEIYKHLVNNKSKLLERNIDNTNLWYGYSRPQNLFSKYSFKILVKEMMPCAEFAVDEEGVYCFSSGYALIPKFDLTREELFMWCCILCTPTMEFQMRHFGTHLHSGWFRMLKSHIEKLHIFHLDSDIKNHLLKITSDLRNNINSEEKWLGLDTLVAKTFGLSKMQIEYIRNYLSQIHITSKRRSCNNMSQFSMSSNSNSFIIETDDLSETAYSFLTEDQRNKYYPVELTKYNHLHVKDDSFRNLVTFSKNKNAPIHNWYSFTQGYSEEIVIKILNEMGYSLDSIVYDPFCGSGTTLLAAKKMNLDCYGADISPLMTWVSGIKTFPWNIHELSELISLVEKIEVEETTNYNDILFYNYMKNAYSHSILNQILFIRNWISDLKISIHLKNFLFMGLIGILEDISYIRKHGSHYRFLNKSNNIGVNKLNVTLIDENTDVKEVFIRKLSRMVNDVKLSQKLYNNTRCKIFNIDTRYNSPNDIKADIVITSPPYLNRNNYFAQQKAEISVLSIIKDMDTYKSLVQRSFCSHIEADLPKQIKSSIPEVNIILDAVIKQESNNAKIPNMIAGYFDDLNMFLSNLKNNLKSESKLSIVVANSRWNGVVIPVDHLLALIAERQGYKIEKIIIARMKGNSPQQMSKYGKIPVRESIVFLSYKKPRK